MSFPLRFLLGSQLYASLGGEDSAGRTASGVALAVAGANPVGVVLTRQLALSRLPDTPATAPAPVTRTPVADFGYAADGLKVKFSDKSTGTVASRSWRFHDGVTSSDKDPTHTYGEPGTYKVELTVVGSDGASNTAARNIELAATTPTPAPPDSTPVAGFVVAVDGLKANFTDKSTGTIASRAWSFGDDGSSSEVHPTHTYGGSGQYTVELAVTDPQGVRNSTEKPVAVSAPGTTPAAPAPAVPVADFGYTVTGLGVQFTDKSHGIAVQSRRWDFGESATSTSTDKDPTFSYQKGGTHKVTLTVTDDKGVSNATTREVVVKK